MLLMIALVSLARALIVSTMSSPENTSEGLNDLALGAGLMYFGTAVDNGSLNESDYVAILNDTREWGQVTPANGLKWKETEPSRNEFDWTLGDQILDPAIENHQIRRCHTLVWHRSLPDWLTTQTWTREELLSILENHIKNVVTNYEGRCYAWDVVNEAFNADGSWRSTIWYDTIGPDFFPFAFTTARKYTTAKLYYNDNNITDINPQSDAVRALVARLRAAGVPIDGVGIQAHHIVGAAPSYARALQNMRLFAATAPGLELAVTELDMRVRLPDNDAQVAQQAADYAGVVRACRDAGACVGVTVWDFWDRVSWVPAARPGFGDAQLFWTNLTRKPAYYAVADVLREGAAARRGAV